MQQNQFKQTEIPYVSAPAVETVSTSSSLSNPVEAYLDQVMTPLEEIRRELRGHLEDIVAANIELGATQEEALEHAKRQFGRSHLITKFYLNKWKLLLDRGLLIQARKTALICFGGESLLTAILLTSTGERINYEPYLLFTVILLLPLFMGFLTGQFVPRKAVRASCEAVFLLSPALLLLYEGWASMQNFDNNPRAGLGFFTAQVIGSVLSGSLGAWVGGRLRGKWQEIRLLLVR